jgi:phage head maturation protease
LGLIEDSPAGRLLIAAIDSGECAGFSIHAMPIRTRERSRLGPGGRPVFDWQEALLVEASACAYPKDGGATVVTIGGRTPRWRAELEAVERDARLRRIWASRPPYLP